MNDFGPLARIENPFSFDAEVDDLGLRSGNMSIFDDLRKQVTERLAEHGWEYEWERLTFVVGNYNSATGKRAIRCLYDTNTTPEPIGDTP